jgi:plastocyanin
VPTAAPPIRAVEAKDFAFSPATLSAPADTAFKIAFSNADAAVPHNVVIATGAGASLFSGKIITGVSSITYAVQALAAGDYRFACVVHPAMTGALTVR